MWIIHVLPSITKLVLFWIRLNSEPQNDRQLASSALGSTVGIVPGQFTQLSRNSCVSIVFNKKLSKIVRATSISSIDTVSYTHLGVYKRQL